MVRLQGECAKTWRLQEVGIATKSGAAISRDYEFGLHSLRNIEQNLQLDGVEGRYHWLHVRIDHFSIVVLRFDSSLVWQSIKIGLFLLYDFPFEFHWLLSLSALQNYKI